MRLVGERPSSLGPVKVAIVGGGPRGLWAAEELVARWRHTPQRTLTVRVFDPCHPGAGQVYRTDQPGCWRLNVRSSAVRTHMGTLDSWREDNAAELADFCPEHQVGDGFPPRKVVGLFLERSWNHLVEALPEACRVEHVPRAVNAAEVREDLLRNYDHVLLATGHASDWPGALSHQPPSSRDGRESRAVRATSTAVPVYGTDGALRYGCEENVRGIAPGSRIVVRGAALTFIDLIMWLRAHPIDGVTVEPYSRSGRFMEVKPDPSGALSNLDSADVGRAAEAIEAARSTEDIEAAIALAAAGLLAAAGGKASEVAISDVLAGHDSSGDPVADLRASLHVAEGAAEPSAAWAVGEAFRRVYSALVTRLSYGGRSHLLDPERWDALAHRMERVAFGPPAVTARAVLDGIDSGLIDPTAMRRSLKGANGLNSGEDARRDSAANEHSDSEAGEDSPAGTTVILADAVIPPPGIVPGTVTAELVDSGVLKRDPSTNAVLSGEDATVPTCGPATLAVVGRDVEGTVLGLDTLSRDMHREIPRWADMIASRAGVR